MVKKFVLIAGDPNSFLNFRGELIKALIAKGFELHLIAPSLAQLNSINTKLKDLGANLHHVPMSKAGTSLFQDIQYLYCLVAVIRKIKPDYVLSYTIKPVIYGLIAARLAGVKNRIALISGLGYAFISASNLLNKLVVFLYTLALKKSYVVFFQNPDDQALFLKLGITKNINTVLVNGSGVDTNYFARTPPPTSSLNFLMIARLLGDKGVREYVAAAKIIKKQHPYVQFNLAGWLDDNPNAIKQLELDEWITDGAVNYFGKLADVRPALMNCNVFVLPSYREGTPRTVLEAMSIGRAIITTDAPGCRETVINGFNGYLVEVKSTNSLVDAMMHFVANPNLCEMMAKESHKIAIEKYDVHKVNQQMLKAMGITQEC